MEIKIFLISDIKPYEKNARFNDKAVDAVVKSIKANGYIAPIIVDENGVILAGHTRYKALKRLGYQELECVVKTGLTEQQKKAYRIADNKIGEIADWDFELLDAELQELLADGYNLDSIGFSDSELNNILKQGAANAERYMYEPVNDIERQQQEVSTEYRNPEKMFERPEQFKSYDENIETEHRCPKCGYEW